MRTRWLQRLCAGVSTLEAEDATTSEGPSLQQTKSNTGRHPQRNAQHQEAAAAPHGHPQPADPALKLTERVQSPVHCQPQLQAAQHPETPQPGRPCHGQPRMELVSDLSCALHATHAQPGLLPGHGSCNVYVELVNNSPHCLTAFMLDPKDPLRCQVLQSPLSIRYYGNAQARRCSAAPAAGAHGPLTSLPLEGSLHMALLRDLFQLEGEAVLQEMLSAVLAADTAGEGHEHARAGGSSDDGWAGSHWQHPVAHGSSSPKPGLGWRRVLRVPMSCRPTHAMQHEGRGAYSPTCHGPPHTSCTGCADTEVAVAAAITPGCGSSSGPNPVPLNSESSSAANSPRGCGSPPLPEPCACPSAQPTPPAPVVGAGAPAAPLLSSSAASRDAADRERYLQAQGRAAIDSSGQQLLHLLLMSTNPSTKQPCGASDTGNASGCNGMCPPPHSDACSVATDSGGMLSTTPPSNCLNVDDSRSGVRDLEDPLLLLLPPGVASPGASCAQARATELRDQGPLERRCNTWGNPASRMQLSPAHAAARFGMGAKASASEAGRRIHSSALGCSAPAVAVPALPCSRSVPALSRPNRGAAPEIPAGPPATLTGSSTGGVRVPLVGSRSIPAGPTARPAPAPAVSRGSPSPSHPPSPTSMYSSKMKAMLDLSASSMGYQLDLAAYASQGSVRGGASRRSIELSRSSQLGMSASCPRAAAPLHQQQQEQEDGGASLGWACQWSVQSAGATLLPPRVDLLCASGSGGGYIRSNSCQSMPKPARVCKPVAPRTSFESIPENILQTPEPSAGSFGSRFHVAHARDTLDIHVARLRGGGRADRARALSRAAGTGAVAAAAGAGMGCMGRTLAVGSNGSCACGAAARGRGPALQLSTASGSCSSIGSSGRLAAAAALPSAASVHAHAGPLPAPARADEVDAAAANADCRWHDVYVTTARDPNGGLLLLMYQTDVTARTGVEDAMAQLNESQLNTLSQMFPRHVVEFLSTGGDTSRPGNVGHLARSHRDVSILFMDIVGFTSMSDQVEPAAVMSFLNELFSIFDSLCTKHKVHKMETAGDCYIVSSGILSLDKEGFNQVQEQHNSADSVGRVFAFAKDMLRCSREVLMPHNGSPVSIRVGINSGPCVSGMVGSKLPKFGIFGDTMNTAARMESTCAPGHIQISAASHALLMTSTLSSSHEWQATNGIEVKGKGTMNTFIWRE